MQPPHYSDDVVYRGSLINVLRRTLPTPSGGRTEFDIVEHPDAVAIVALRADPTRAGGPLVALVQQERPAIKRSTWEIPAGLVNPTEAGQPEQTARRELREETGYKANKWVELSSFWPSPGYIAEKMNLFLALELTEGQQEPMEDERIELRWFAEDELGAMIREKKILDGKTMIGYYLWLEYKRHTLAA